MTFDGKKTKHSKHPEKKHRVRCSPVPDFITCPRCGFEMELWSEVEETKCLVCGHRFFKRESTVH